MAWVAPAAAAVTAANTVYRGKRAGDQAAVRDQNAQDLIDELTGGASGFEDHSLEIAEMEREMFEQALAQEAAMFNAQMQLSEAEYDFNVGNQQARWLGTTDALGNRTRFDPKRGQVTDPSAITERIIGAGARQEQLNRTVEDARARILSERAASAQQGESQAADAAFIDYEQAGEGTTQNQIAAMLSGGQTPSIAPASIQALRQGTESNIPELLSAMAPAGPSNRSAASLQAMQAGPQIEAQRRAQSLQEYGALRSQSTTPFQVPYTPAATLSAAQPSTPALSVGLPRGSTPGIPNLPVPQADDSIDPRLLSLLAGSGGGGQGFDYVKGLAALAPHLKDLYDIFNERKKESQLVDTSTSLGQGIDFSSLTS